MYACNKATNISIKDIANASPNDKGLPNQLLNIDNDSDELKQLARFMVKYDVSEITYKKDSYISFWKSFETNSIDYNSYHIMKSLAEVNNSYTFEGLEFNRLKKNNSENNNFASSIENNWYFVSLSGTVD